MNKQTFLPAVLLAAAATTIAACAPQEHKAVEPSSPEARELNIKAHLEFLADDLLKGRDTGTRGHEIASLYIESQFKALGIQPAGSDGYYQWVPLRSTRMADPSPELTINFGGEQIEFEFRKDFIAGPSGSAESQEVTAPLVFVGYGLVSDKFEIDDYAGLDVEGAIVVTLSGRPDNLPSEESAHLNRQKSVNAAERGAVGMINVHTPEREAISPWERSLMYLRTPRMSWLEEDGSPHGAQASIQGAASIHFDAAARLFEHSGHSAESIFSQMEAGESPAGFELEGVATMRRHSSHEEIQSPNIIGMIEGSDPDLKHEYVVYTAHSDHIGVIPDFSRDNNINNGALDNASGVAIMIETARMFQELANRGQGPARSIIFAAVTAEEKGLLGADFYANNPTVPLENIVANVNLDMPVLLYPFADIVAFGAQHSSLGDTVEKAAGEFGIALSPDPMPEQAIFTRSDHYALVRQGIPAVFLMTGFTSKDEELDGGEIWGQFFAEQYHRPGDDIATLNEVYGGIRYDSAALFANINFRIGKEIANSEERPHWLAESYFGQVFAGGEGSIRH